MMIFPPVRHNLHRPSHVDLLWERPASLFRKMYFRLVVSDLHQKCYRCLKWPRVCSASLSAISLVLCAQNQIRALPAPSDAAFALEQLLPPELIQPQLPWRQIEFHVQVFCGVLFVPSTRDRVADLFQSDGVELQPEPRQDVSCRAVISTHACEPQGLRWMFSVRLGAVKTHTFLKFSHQSPPSAPFRSGFSCAMQGGGGGGGGGVETFGFPLSAERVLRGCAVATVPLCCVPQPTHRCNSLVELSAQPTHAPSRPSIDSCMPTHFITSRVSMVTSTIHPNHYPSVGVDYSVGASRG